MNAREDILGRIRARKSKSAATPAPYVPPALPADPVAQFRARALSVAADVRDVAGIAAIPEAVADLLRGKNLPARIQLPAHSPLRGLPWTKVPGLTLQDRPPGPDEAALATAQFGIAETGTLVYAAAPDRPPSWHYRPGFEIAVLHARDIVERFEDVISSMKASPVRPSTVNLVTGPSRTADIEQTLELGAHGPKALAILIVRD